MKSFLLFFIVLHTVFSFSQKNDTLFFYFEVNSSTIIQNGNTQKNIDLLNENEFESVHFFACTDTTGSIKHNQKLAKNRLKNTLKNVKVISKNITFNSVGESNRFISLTENRCVYVVVVIAHLEKPKVIHTIEKQEKLVLNLSFVPGEYILLPASTPILNDLFLHLDTISYSKIELHGHVCCGHDENLSLMRAKTVENELIQHGIARNKIQCFGHSNFEPLYEEYSAENKQKNRRVEVTIFP